MKKVKMFEFLTNCKAQKKVQKEQGRSMVEMLGVLAIIGVLSVGGIAGYSMAMNRYKANQVLDIAGKLSVMVQSAVATDPNFWDGDKSDIFNELDIDYYGGNEGGIPQYEVTFHIWEWADSSPVWGGSYDNGVQKALGSITGNEFFDYSGTAGPLTK